GVITDSPISSSMFAGLKGNKQDLEPVRKEKIAALIEKPAAVSVRRKIKKDLKREARKSMKKRFAGGIKSLVPRSAGVIGNVALGSEYHLPTAPKNTTNHDIIDGADTVRPGEQITQDNLIPGYYQTASVFSTFEMGRYSVDGNLDLRWDEWGGVQLDALTAKSTIGPQHFGVGDFNESGSEISISSLPVRGAKYGIGLFENKQKKQRFSVTGLMGESERPYDEGERVLGSYGEHKTSGSAVAQRVVGLVKADVMAARNWDIHFHYVYSNDLRDAILRPDLSRTAVTSQDLLKSNMIGVENEWRFLKDNLTLTAEVNVGTVDSTTQAYNLALDEVLEDRGLTEQTGNLLNAILQPTVTTTYRDSNLADAMGALIAAGSLRDSTEIIDSLTAAGESRSVINEALYNYRMEELQSLRGNVERLEPDMQDQLDASKDYGFRWEDQGMAARLALTMNLGGTALDAAYTFIGAGYYTGGNAFLVKDQRKYDVSLSRDISKKLNINTDYYLTVENSSSGGKHKNLLGFGEGSELGLLADGDFQKQMEGLDGLRPKFTHNWDSKVRYNLSSVVELNFQYGLRFKMEDKSSELDSDSSIIFADPYFDATGTDTSTFIYNNFSYYRDPGTITDYNQASNNDSIPLARVLQDRELVNSLGLKTKIRFSKMGNVSLGGKWKWTNDYSSYKQTGLLDSYQFQDSTLENLGYFRDGEDEFNQDYDLAFTLKTKTMSNKIDTRFGLKTKVKDSEDQISWSVKDVFKWKIIPRKLRLTLSGKVKSKVTTEDDTRYFVDDNGQSRYFYMLNSDSSVTLVDDVKHSKAIMMGEPDTLIDVTHAETFRPKIRENEYSYEVKTRYSFNTKLYTEALFSQLWYLRPDQLEYQYTDIFGKVEFFYSF
ncbi:hypothetical protein ACFL5V_11980, partial [Fibrobacterota bacterium]